MVNYKHYIKNAQFIREIINKELEHKRLEIKDTNEDIKNLIKVRELIKKGVVMAKEHLKVKEFIDNKFNRKRDELKTTKENKSFLTFEDFSKSIMENAKIKCEKIFKEKKLDEIDNNITGSYNLKNHKEYLEYFENLIKELTKKNG